MSWGQEHLPVNGGAGTTGEIEEANEHLDRLSVPRGPLAVRVVELIKNIDMYL